MTSDGFPAYNSHAYRCEISSSWVTCCCSNWQSACESDTAHWSVMTSACYEETVVNCIYDVSHIIQLGADPS